MNYIVLPVFNEEAAIAKVIDEIAGILGREGFEHRFLVVDDGSTDRTPRILEELRQRHDLRVVRHARNQGIRQVFGTAFSTLSEICSDQDRVVLLESDDTNEPGILPGMLRLLQEGNDIVIASRFAQGGVFRGFPFWREAGCRVVNRTLRWLIPVDGVTDYTIFYRGYSAGLVRKLVGQYRESLFSLNGFVANAEMLSKAARFRPRVAEVPLEYKYFQKVSPSRLKIFYTSFQYLRLICGHKRPKG